MKRNRCLARLCIIIFLLLLYGLIIMSYAAAEKQEWITMYPGESKVFEVIDLKRVATSKPEIVDVKVIDRNEVMVTAKAPGLATIHFWTSQATIVKNIEVTEHNTALQNQIQEAIGLSKVKVTVYGNSVLLEGEVENQSQSEYAEKIAGVYKEKVVNLLKITSPQQILMQVQVLEVRKDSTDEYGFSWGELNGASVFNFGTITVGEESVGGPFVRYGRVMASIKALVDTGKAKVLAVPSLLTQDRKPAKFHAGGEIPYAVPDKEGLKIIWKEYGVILKIVPHIRIDDEVEMLIAPEVSELDWSYSLNISGYEIPGFRARKMETSLVVKNGTTIIMGGLISQDQTEAVAKIPVLGDLPILGPLFRSKKFVNEETELILCVTPFIVKNNELVNIKQILNSMQESLLNEAENPMSSPKASEK